MNDSIKHDLPSKVKGKCQGGCTLWDCARPKGHPGPFQPANDDEQPPDVKGFLTTFMAHKFLVQSKTNPAMWYMVDIAAHTCECRWYLERKTDCEHIDRAIKHRGENR